MKDPKPPECAFSFCRRPASVLSEIGFCEMHRLEAQGQTAMLEDEDRDWLLKMKRDKQSGTAPERTDA